MKYLLPKDAAKVLKDGSKRGFILLENIKTPAADAF